MAIKEEEPLACKLVQLQEDMQTLLMTQMKYQENSRKKETERLSSVKLPKIEIISFSGDKTKWIEFWDSFQCDIHNNKSMSNVEKFNYLRSKLAGEARGAIAGLALSNDNYDVAIDILHKRFGNPQDIVDIHYNQLINMQPATNKVSSLRVFLDKVERHLRCLEVLKQNIEQDVFVSMIRSKLPEDVLIQLEIQNGSRKWTVSSLTEKLHEYVVACERATKEPQSVVNKTRHDESSSSIKLVTNKKSGYVNNGEPIYRSSTQSLITTGTNQRTTKKPFGASVNKCRYCQQQHWSDECKQYKTISERNNRIRGSCFKCLKDGHSFKDCKTNKTCVYCGEMNVHHRSLCPKRFQPHHSVTNVASEIETRDERVEESSLMSTNETVLTQTALTEIRNPDSNATSPVRLFLDSGSHRSYITHALAKTLNLTEDGEQDIHLVTFGSSTPKKITTKITKLDVRLKSGKHMQITANIVPVISGELQRRIVDDLWSDEVQDIVRSVELADEIPMRNELSPIELLIGNDYYLDLVHGEKIMVQQGLYLLASKLGWILTGRVTDQHDVTNESNMLILTYGNAINTSNVFSSIDASVPTKPDLEDFWSTEAIGIVDKELRTDDAIAMTKFRETLKFEENRYQVTWPWKEDNPDLPTNKELAIGRLKSSFHRLMKKPEMMQKYDKVIRDQLEKGEIEKVDATQIDGVLHYLPHHAVIKPDRATTKLRVVYDASAKTRRENHSLNECLYRGPVMLHDLCGMLMRFRLHSIAILADIEKAFLQIGLQRDQRDVTRFIWLKDTNKAEVSTDNLQEYRFCRDPFGIISSPFLLGATIEHHLDTYNSEIADKIKSDIYVDNVITGAKSVTEDKELYTVSKGMFQEGSMNLREWISSSEEVNKSFAPEDKTDLDYVKVLGHKWNVQEDTLSFKPSTSIINSTMIKKRSVLKQIASLFDPLGVVCPVILRGKMFLQHLWKKSLGWDDILDTEDQNTWRSLKDDLDQISKLCIPRSIATDHTQHTEYRLLCFCDASEKAYAAVIYLHQATENQSKTSLIFAKTRLAPLKKISIPRLELLAVIIGMRCLMFVKKSS